MTATSLSKTPASSSPLQTRTAEQQKQRERQEHQRDRKQRKLWRQPGDCGWEGDVVRETRKNEQPRYDRQGAEGRGKLAQACSLKRNDSRPIRHAGKLFPRQHSKKATHRDGASGANLHQKYFQVRQEHTEKAKRMRSKTQVHTYF